MSGGPHPVRRTEPLGWRHASNAVAEVYFPHELHVLGGGPEPRLTLSSLDLGPVVIGQVGWGADVAIECDYPASYEVNLPLTGHLESRGRFGRVVSLPGQGTVFRADSPCLISHWDATCTVLGVKFDSAWLETESERVLGTDRSTVRARLPEQLPLEHGTGRAWRQLVGSVAAHLREPGLFADAALVRAQLAAALASGLLLAACPESGAAPAPGPRRLRLLLDALHDEPERAWTVSEMAACAGTSVRRLQEDFRDWVNRAPSEYLVDIRLQRARAQLLDDPRSTVSEIAARWGFSSASRFAAAYRRRYGEPPSQARR